MDKLAATPHTRRAQAVTWKAWVDPDIEDPPCLQRIWFRILGDTLICNVHMRSNDAYKAAFMNMFAFVDLQRIVAERISEKIGRDVKVGRYVDITDSLHIYGSYFTEALQEIEKMQDGNYKARSWQSDHPAFQMMTEEAREKLAQDPDWYAKGKG